MKDTRPINLNLFTIRFPIPAIVSILHRMSGVLLFLSFPLLVWVFDWSMQSPKTFRTVVEAIQNPLIKFTLWVFLSAAIYHILAGIRHLFMDAGFGDSKRGGRITAAIVLLLSLVLILLTGIRLW